MDPTDIKVAVKERALPCSREDIKVIVKGNRIRPEGSVDWTYQRQRAALAVARVTHARCIVNRTGVLSRFPPAEIKRRVGETSKRAGECGAGKISIAQSGTASAVPGAVRSWAENAKAHESISGEVSKTLSTIARPTNRIPGCAAESMGWLLAPLASFRFSELRLRLPTWVATGSGAHSGGAHRFRPELAGAKVAQSGSVAVRIARSPLRNSTLRTRPNGRSSRPDTQLSDGGLTATRTETQPEGRFMPRERSRRYLDSTPVHPEADPAARAAALDTLDACGSLMRFRSGERISRCGNPEGYWYRVVSGVARCCSVLPNGRRQIIDLLLPGDFLAVADDERESLWLEAVVNSTAVVLYPKHEAEKLVAAHAGAARAICDLAFRTIARSHQQLLLRGRPTATAKVGWFLLNMSDRLTRGRLRDEIMLHMSRYDIADYLSLSVETVSRAFTSLRERHAIAFSGAQRVRILDRMTLESEERRDVR